MRQQERLRLADSTPAEAPSIERHLVWLDALPEVTAFRQPVTV